tara:strand:+ start:976 stop:1590 length:615 start_codon:yes stop_codon:yes gene_type:complete
MAIIRANNNTLSSVTALPFATGGLVKLYATVASSASTADFDLTSATVGTAYKTYFVTVSGLSVSTDSANFGFNINTTSGGLSSSVAFAKGGVRNHINSSGGDNSVSSTSSFHATGNTSTARSDVNYYLSNATGEVSSCHIYLHNLLESVNTSYFWNCMSRTSHNYLFTAMGSGYNNQNQATPHIRFFCSSGNFSGTITIYGLTT